MGIHIAGGRIMTLLHHPFWVFAIALIGLWLASLAGLWLRNRSASADGKRSEDFDLILGSALTLLALLVGFSFSMAAERYGQRKTFEEAEANAIGTEYVRADLLPPPAAANVRTLLAAYLGQRILFYTNDYEAHRAQIDRRMNELQAALWTAVRDPAAAQPPAVATLVLGGMNDVLNSSGYTQAAFWNRIPQAAWWLMAAIAVCCNVMLGYGSRSTRAGGPLSLLLPLMVSVSFLLIADIDAPRHGLIRVVPENLEALAASVGR
jgi:hypothetical protein